MWIHNSGVVMLYGDRYVPWQQFADFGDGMICDLGDAPGPYGVLGHFDSLTLTSGKPFQGKRVLARDITGDEAIDISDMVHIRDKSLSIPDDVIRSVYHTSHHNL